MAELPRGICPECGANRALRNDGTMRAHRRTTKQGYRLGPCRGEDKPPATTEES